SAPVGRVMLGNREVAVLRATVLGVGAPERARLASDRIAALLERGVPDEVHVVTEPSGKVFSIAGRGLFVLTPGDLDEARGETLDGAVAAAGRNLATALAEARERRSLPHLLRAMGWSVAATLVLVLLLVAVERSRRWLLERAVAAARERMRELHVPGALLESDHVYLGTKRGLLFVARALELAAVYLWLTFVLERFAWTRPWGEQLGTWLLRTLSTLGLAALAGLPGLVVVAVIFVATRFLVKLIGLFFTAVEEGRVEVSPALAETAEPTRKIVTVVVWVFALIMAYPYLPGSGSEAFKGVGVMVGLMVSLGSTALIGQLASGFVLMYSRTLKVGDFIRAGDVEGTVVALGLFATKVRTLKQEEVTVPNGVLAGMVTKNFSRTQDPAGVIVGTSVTIGYDTPWRQVEGLLLLAAERAEGLKRDPAPWVVQRSLSDFYVDYELCAYIEDPRERPLVLSALHAAIQDAFNEHGVQIMSPNYEDDPEGAKLVPKERWFDAPAVPDASASRRRHVSRSAARPGHPGAAEGGPE
ncbi:MAG: mechanosensitive ion channel family protein, partial [Acidobacteria bacterium ACB2]|nr:mechanosensitive ion channel family protein [Acidobacteria bacterium ACB2]